MIVLCKIVLNRLCTYKKRLLLINLFYDLNLINYTIIGIRNFMRFCDIVKRMNIMCYRVANLNIFVINVFAVTE